MTELKIHAESLDGETLQQIYKMKNHPSIVGQIAIMPDAHAGAGCTIGTTCTFGESVIPNVVGVDIGCGVLGCKIGNIEIDYPKFDTELKKKIPLGMTHREQREGESLAEKNHVTKILDEAISVREKFNSRRKNSVPCQLGTLGGGNHFIEVGQENTGDMWIFIHSGSRNFGLTVAQYYQNMAPKNSGVPRGMECLLMEEGGKEYLKDMKVAQKFARANRFTMLDVILDVLDIQKKNTTSIDSVHNFIADDGICRKGAISAYKGEAVLIPLNMRDGTVIGVGKGNPEYNFSAPHGAGRLFGRNEMKKKLSSGEITVEAFKNEMDGIYTSTVTAGTIDESPFAYKPFEMIRKYLEETVDIQTIVKPVYNLKGTE